MRATFAVLLLLATPAHAQVSDEELARAHYLTAQSYYQQGRVREALQQFDEAYRISKRPALHYNMGICYERLGQTADAIAAYDRYLSEDTTATDRVDVQAHIDQLRARLPPPAPPPAPVRAPPPESVVASQPAPKDEKKPLVKQGWFWGVVGGGAGLVVLAVVVGVVAGTSGNDGPRTLAPVPLR
jgi:tetratricopeptide (TPR) repeat protein